jgi:hypothetical protein
MWRENGVVILFLNLASLRELFKRYVVWVIRRLGRKRRPVSRLFLDESP